MTSILSPITSAVSGHSSSNTALPFRTLRDLLRYGISHLHRHSVYFGHGSHEAFDEVAYLLLHTLKLPLDNLDPFLDATLLPDEIEACMSILERRATERLPAAYLTHEAWLGEYRFYVDQRTIVPRSYIAELIPQALSPWIRDPASVRNILDLCTGSGCLPIMLADIFSEAHVDAVDISADALAVAQKNVDTYELNDRIRLIESNLYQQIGAQQYDLIISNPPYVNDNAMQQLPKEYLHEPRIALAGGVDGMDLVRLIVAGASQRLKPGGILLVEIGNEGAHAEAAFPDLELTWVSTSAGDDKVFLLTAEQLV